MYRGDQECNSEGCLHVADLGCGPGTGWCPYKFTDINFRKWGPEIEVPKRVQLEFNILPVLSVHIFGGEIAAHVRLDNKLTIDISFSEDCDGNRRSGSDSAPFAGVNFEYYSPEHDGVTQGLLDAAPADPTADALHTGKLPKNTPSQPETSIHTVILTP